MSSYLYTIEVICEAAFPTEKALMSPLLPAARMSSYYDGEIRSLLRVYLILDNKMPFYNSMEDWLFSYFDLAGYRQSKTSIRRISAEGATLDLLQAVSNTHLNLTPITEDKQAMLAKVGVDVKLNQHPTDFVILLDTDGPSLRNKCAEYMGLVEFIRIQPDLFLRNTPRRIVAASGRASRYIDTKAPVPELKISAGEAYSILYGK